MSPNPVRDRVDLQRALQRKIRGGVHFDSFARALYSTDASIYQIEPIGVAFPCDEEDLCASVEACAEAGVPLVARGAGTSLAGQAIGPGLIVDCSRSLRQIHRIDADSRTAEVAPGATARGLNEAARPFGLMLGPDPASIDRATLGGMIANNSTGAHSIRYGMMADHVLALDAILSDGSTATFGPLAEPEARRRAEPSRLEGRIYQAVLEIRARHAAAIRRDWPSVWRRASGYGLERLVEHAVGRPPGWYEGSGPYPPTGGLNLAPLMCGSEGTLAVIRRATVRLVPRPAVTVLVVLEFPSIVSACDAAPAILESGPAAVELIPRTLIERARSVPAYGRKLSFVDGDPQALLVVEYAGDSLAAALGASAAIRPRGRLLESAEAQADLWAVRKAGLGLLLSVPGDAKPVSFIEDVTVPVDRLGEYVRNVDRLLRDHGTHGEWYAHASAGCLHMRPLIDLKTVQGVAAMRAIGEAIVEEVLRLRGVLSGEHGDGLAHTEFTERLFGPGITQAFRELKQAFDPGWILNPGKVVTPAGVPPPSMDTALRFGPAYRAPEPKTVFAFRREGGFVKAVEACNGAGVCLQPDGVMCPSYQATRREGDTTRGRANALRAAISGQLPAGSLTSPEMAAILDLCLQCKGCKAECPSAVDMGHIKSEFLEMLHATEGTPLRSRIFSEIHALSRSARPVAGFANTLLGSPFFRKMMERTLGIASRRKLPAFRKESFRRWLAANPPPAEGRPIVLFVDTFTDFNYPEIGIAAAEVLARAGFSIRVARGQGCCGRPAISKGLLHRARQMAARNLDALAPYVAQGMPVVGLEPSCLVTLRDEYVDFFPNDSRAHALAEASLLIEELLTRSDPEGAPPVSRLSFKPGGDPILFHAHCHAKASAGAEPTLAMLRAAGAQVQEADAGCCGMAGAFGYEAEHYDFSLQVAENRLLPAVRQAAAAGARVAASGASCRAQILDATRIPARHPIELVAAALLERSP